jgi:hypothetical protein
MVIAMAWGMLMAAVAWWAIERRAAVHPVGRPG